MIKTSVFHGETEFGPTSATLFGKSDRPFERLVQTGLSPDVVRFVENIQPKRDSLYVLVSALSGVERWGSNVNPDAFTEVSLKHRPQEWSGDPALDRPLAQRWPYGFPTFYSGNPFAHHRNRDPTRGLGELVLALWNDHMKRVELAIRWDRERCERFDGMKTWECLAAGEHPDVSMGCRVPWDRCSVCTDMAAYRGALATFDPRIHKHPGEAVRNVHKRLRAETGTGIRGIALSRREYCECMRYRRGRILPDGRKVFVYNDFPVFFDISHVTVGADRVAKTMLFLPSCGRPRSRGAETQATSVKEAAMNKRVAPVAPVAPRDAIKAIEPGETPLPRDVIDELAKAPLPDSVATATSLGIVLKPAEFQRLVLVRNGDAALANSLSAAGSVIPPPVSAHACSLGRVLPQLLALLLPWVSRRSFHSPHLEGRVLLGARECVSCAEPLIDSPLLRDVAALYAGYRKAVSDFVLPSSVRQPDGAKTATSARVVLPRLSAEYVKIAFTSRNAFGG